MSCPRPTSPRCAPASPRRRSSTARRRPAGRRGSSNRTCRRARGPELERVRALVETRLTEHAVFALATRPKTILGPLFSRYEPGHAYGTHVDDALMGGVRSDVSFTLFLSDAGRATTAASSSSTAPRARRPSSSRPAASSPIRQPTLHRVAPVTRGRAAGGGRLGAQLRPRRGPARAAVRPRDRAPAPVRPRGQDGGGRSPRQVRRQPPAPCGARIDVADVGCNSEAYCTASASHRRNTARAYCASRSSIALRPRRRGRPGAGRSSGRRSCRSRSSWVSRKSMWPSSSFEQVLEQLHRHEVLVLAADARARCV